MSRLPILVERSCMDITKALVDKVKAAAKRYDSAPDMEARISAGQELDAVVDGLSDRQVEQMPKIIGR